MRLGGFFEGSKRNKSQEVQENVLATSSDELVLNRRQVLLGLGVLAATSVLPIEKTEAKEQKFYSLGTPEGIEKNLQNIEAYQEWLQRPEHIAALANETTSREVLDNIIFLNGYVPITERKYLKGGRFDHEELYKASGSFPSIQMRLQETQDSKIELEIRFADNEPNVDEASLLGYANGFVIDNNIHTNWHVADFVEGNGFECERLDDVSVDVAGCTITDMVDNKVLLEKASRISLSLDRSTSVKNMHGEYVDATGIHETRGEGHDKTDIASGVLIKITPVILKHYFIKSEMYSTDYNKLLNSYMYITSPRNVNSDDVADNYDVSGMSGSPIFAHSDTSKDRLVPRGLVWGAWPILHQAMNTSHTVVLVHGPDALVAMNDKLNTIASYTDEKDILYKHALTSKIQRELSRLGYYDAIIDGDYGAQTQTAVGLFQKSVFNKETLVSSVIPFEVDRRTWDKLFPDEAGVNKQELYDSLGRQLEE